ncbi:uncharacterized protein LOC143637128 [Bidens hawaiensis]|uniref:uncharacterized protein LOC143637128 n=1 Tax=Bidens hawaiensis TaxID=980011 RepID=UPI00404AB2DA
MTHKHTFQALDKSCKDVLKSKSLFEGKVVVFGGDFRQILPRGLLAPTNEVVHEINDRLLGLFHGDPVEYLSSDSVSKSDYIDGNVDPTLYSTEILNGLRISGLPNHKLILKVGVPVMLLRNIDQKKGLCNGTRLQVVSMGTHVIGVKILSGTHTGERISIPRIALTPSYKSIAFTFTRRQYPLSVCFAMTINKSQGQSLTRVGLYLKNDVFSHGQLALCRTIKSYEQKGSEDTDSRQKRQTG